MCLSYYFIKVIFGRAKMAKFNLEQIEQAVRLILEAIGEDPNREGLIDTPKRVAKMYEEVFSGMHEDPKEIYKKYLVKNMKNLCL